MKHLLFVDDEPKVLQGLERQLRSMRNDWTMEFVANGARAMEIMENRPVDVIVTDELTQHCWMTGTFARRIAEAEHSDGRIDDQCFLGGLLHDVGRLILASGLPDEYAEVLASARARGWTVLEAEQAKFGASHAEVGAHLLGLWCLPNPIIEAVALHHRPMETSCESFSAVIAVHVANAFAHDLSGSHLKWPGSQIDMDALSRAGLAGRVDAWRERCLAEKL